MMLPVRSLRPHSAAPRFTSSDGGKAVTVQIRYL